MFCLYSVFFFFYCCRDHGDLPSFPTRRSSDLGASGCATTAVRPAPTAVPRSSSASSRGVSDPASRSRSAPALRSEEHTSELQSLRHLVCRLLLEKKKEPQHTVL